MGMIIKLKKRVGISTPSPTWKFESPSHSSFTKQEQEQLQFELLLATNTNTSTKTSSVSARKLGAILWEALPRHRSKMSHAGARVAQRRRQRKGSKVPNHIDEALDDNHPYEELPSDSSLKRHIAASLIQHHRSVERGSRALQPVSPASFSSSMEVTPYNRSLTPSISLSLKGRIGESSFNLKTSQELVKVLNRIWSLEEQHASSISLVKSLKMELDRTQVRMKGLLQEKNKEQNRTKSTVKELNDERKLRKQSESLHRKLARELTDTKTSFSETLKEFEREKNARSVLENLCDEFAKGIRDYEQEVRYLKLNKPEKDRINRESPNRLVLHLSETWLDERMQMKQAKTQYDYGKDTIVDRLSLEIETFLRAKNSLEKNKSSSKRPNKSRIQRHSVESFHLNEATSVLDHNAKDEEDSSDSNCFESQVNENPKSKNAKKKKVFSRKNHEKVLEVSEATTKWDNGVKESTLKAKLLEARLEGQQHSLLKASKSSA